MDDLLFSIYDLKTEKQRELFEYSVKMSAKNKIFKQTLKENTILPTKNYVQNTYLRRYYKEIFDQPQNIVEIFEQQIEIKTKENYENEAKKANKTKNKKKEK